MSGEAVADSPARKKISFGLQADDKTLGAMCSFQFTAPRGVSTIEDESLRYRKGRQSIRANQTKGTRGVLERQSNSVRSSSLT